METDLRRSSFVCKQSTCKFPIDGKCIEDLAPPKKCPHRSAAELTTNENLPEDGQASNQAEIGYVNTHKGEALTDENCHVLMANLDVKVIVLAGLRNSGKSTLLGSLIQLFQDRTSFAGYNFAGSTSLIGFERICHYSRMNSGRMRPGTGRTVKGIDGILHLRIKELASDSKKLDLLFTDLSGEDFDELSKSTQSCKSFTLAKRADHFVLFLDADLLSTMEERHVIKTNSISVLLGLLDANMIVPLTKLDIVFSRWDLLIEKDRKETHKKFINQIKTDLVELLRPHNLEVRFFEIASRPDKQDVLEFGYGLDKLFTNWAKSKRAVEESKVRNSSINAKRQFSKYTVN